MGSTPAFVQANSFRYNLTLPVMVFDNIRKLHRNNVRALRNSPAAEISGSLGDLGTLLPLMITLAVQGSISLSTTLVFTGVFNIVTGVVFGIPLPVQPMKVSLL